MERRLYNPNLLRDCTALVHMLMLNSPVSSCYEEEEYGGKGYVLFAVCCVLCAVTAATKDPLQSAL